MALMTDIDPGHSRGALAPEEAAPERMQVGVGSVANPRRLRLSASGAPVAVGDGGGAQTAA